MNSNRDAKLSIFLYKYINRDNTKFINNPIIKEKTNMDINFKEELKQHFKALSLIHKNELIGNI